MVNLTEKERKIVRELIRNPRISDSEISKKTNIPVMTVNRRRKYLEENELIEYYASIVKSKGGFEVFQSRELFIVKFAIGITAKEYLEKLERDGRWQMLNSKYISFAYLGEDEGHLALILAVDSTTTKGSSEEFNGKIVPYLRQKMGKDSILKVRTVSLTNRLRVHHNYLPGINIEKGNISKKWPDDLIFVDEVEK